MIAIASDIGFTVEHLDFSPIKGPEGNIEFLLHLSKNAPGEILISEDRIDEVAQLSHEM